MAASWFLEEVAAYLDALNNADIGRLMAAGPPLGGTLRLGAMPDKPDGLNVLYEYPGLPPIETMGGDGTPVLEVIGLHVESRAATYQEARRRAWAVWRALVKVGGAVDTVGGVHYLRIQPQGSPTFLRADPESDPPRTLFVANYQATKELSPAS